MESNIIIGIIIIVIGTLFLAVAAVNPENFIVYEVLKARAMCVSEGNRRYFIMMYSLMMIIFGGIVTAGLFRRGQVEKEE